jgi:hypothetical protein
MVREKSLLPRPDFQRRTVWTNPDKIAFIETILSNFPFPEIYIAASSVDTTSGEATEMLVDGQQRIQTIDDYFRGVSPFRSSRSIKAYKDLEEEQKKDFLNYEVAVRNLGINEEGTIREVFWRMNRTAYNLNDMERFNAVYLGLYKKLSEALAETEFLKEIRLFSSTDVRRMKDVSYMASLIATMMSAYFNRDDEVESYLETYNDAFPQLAEMNARFGAVVAFLHEMDLSERSRAWRKVDFYNLVVEADRQLFAGKRRPDPKQAGEALTALYEAVDKARHDPPTDENVRRYFEATLQNTNDRGQRIARGEVVRAILESLPHEPFEVEVPKEDPHLPDLAEIEEQADAAEQEEAAHAASEAHDLFRVEEGLRGDEGGAAPAGYRPE